MAADLAGKDIATVVTDDDVAVEKSKWSTGRPGVAGTLIVEKVVGAAAEAGASLAELKALGNQVNRRTRSLGGVLTSCTVSTVGKRHLLKPRWLCYRWHPRTNPGDDGDQA